MSNRQALIESIQLFQTEIAKAPDQAGYAGKSCDLNQFALLLGGISCYRKAPGINEMKVEELYICETEQDKSALKEHLQTMFGVVDEYSLKDACAEFFSADEEYRQFLTFWQAKPLFELNELNEDGRKAFELSLSFAEIFKEFVEERGFFAWDCNEQLGLLRRACACGIISQEAFWAQAKELAKKAARIYKSWEEYAISCLCGAVYFMFLQNGRNEEHLLGFFGINHRIIQMLFFENPFWTEYQWFQPQAKKFAIPPAELKPLLKDWKGAQGCMSTDKITVEGKEIGYMYRQPGINEFDSGWRFLAGDESDQYLNDPDNWEFYGLNTICNYTPDILEHLDSPPGIAYARDNQGKLKAEELH